MKTQKLSLPTLAISLLTAIATAVAISAFPLKAEAVTFGFEFNNVDPDVGPPLTPEGQPLLPPIVGTGFFKFNKNGSSLPDGTYLLNDPLISNPEFFFDFVGGDTFTNTNLITPTNEAQVILYSVNNVQYVKFGNVNPNGSDDLGLNGSLDFVIPDPTAPGDLSLARVLSFDSPTVSPDLTTYNTNDYAGNYRAKQEIPEPGTVLGLLVLGGLGAASLIKRTK